MPKAASGAPNKLVARMHGTWLGGLRMHGLDLPDVGCRLRVRRALHHVRKLQPDTVRTTDASHSCGQPATMS